MMLMPSHASPRSFRGFSYQFVLCTLASLLYFGVRALSKDQHEAAFANAGSLLRFERALGLDWESAAQEYILNRDHMVTFFNWVYIYLHWPLIIAAMVLLYRYSRGQFTTLRNAMIASGAIGLLFFAFYPVAPPRLFDPSQFFDSVTSLSSSYKVLQNPSIVNKYAALPSFHVGWNVLVGIAIWRAARLRIIKLFALASPLLMTMAVVVTANHWVVDIFAGAGIALIGLFIAHLIRRVTENRQPRTLEATIAT